MKAKFKKIMSVALTLASVGLLLSACSGKRQGGANGTRKTEHTVALIPDVAGVDDRSFSQSAWEGLQAYGKEHGLSRGNNGYQYFASSSASDFVPNINQAANAKFGTIFGIGYALKDAIATQARKYPKQNFVIVDDTIKGQKNVASANFKSNDAAYLAGVAAGEMTKTNTVGFIGGVHGDIIDLFAAGFTKGVQDTAKKRNKKITILNQYVGDFTSADKAKSIAQSMYAKKADIIFHAAGGAGQGLFQEAKAINQTRPANQKVWVIGVDSDQSELGKYTAKGGQRDNFTLTSVMTGVNVAVKDLSDRAYQGKFPGGKNLIYGLKGNGVYITKGNLPSKVWNETQKQRQNILSGKLVVPKHPNK